MACAQLNYVTTIIVKPASLPIYYGREVGCTLL